MRIDPLSVFNEIFANAQMAEEGFHNAAALATVGQKSQPAVRSGFRLLPESIEFWYGRPDRLHERHPYVRRGEDWDMNLLYP
jgi:pyridoxamine 5'-phosphate oxidase